MSLVGRLTLIPILAEVGARNNSLFWFRAFTYPFWWCMTAVVKSDLVTTNQSVLFVRVTFRWKVLLCVRRISESDFTCHFSHNPHCNHFCHILHFLEVISKIPDDRIIFWYLGMVVTCISMLLGRHRFPWLAKDWWPSSISNTTYCHDSRSANSLLKRLKDFIVHLISMIGNQESLQLFFLCWIQKSWLPDTIQENLVLFSFFQLRKLNTPLCNSSRNVDIP